MWGWYIKRQFRGGMNNRISHETKVVITYTIMVLPIYVIKAIILLEVVDKYFRERGLLHRHNGTVRIACGYSSDSEWDGKHQTVRYTTATVWGWYACLCNIQCRTGWHSYTDAHKRQQASWILEFLIKFHVCTPTLWAVPFCLPYRLILTVLLE